MQCPEDECEYKIKAMSRSEIIVENLGLDTADMKQDDDDEANGGYAYYS
jgi:hypothetical protein